MILNQILDILLLHLLIFQSVALKDMGAFFDMTMNPLSVRVGP